MRHLDNDDNVDPKVVVKIMSFVADVLTATDVDEKWCRHLLKDNLLQKDDLDHVEKFVYCLVHFEKLCRSEMSANGQLGRWLVKAKQVVKENQESESDFEKTLLGIQQLFVLLNLTKTEL